MPDVEFVLPWVCFVLLWVWLFCRELSFLCHNLGLSCRDFVFCWRILGFVVAVTPVDHRSLELRTKINRAPGIPIELLIKGSRLRYAFLHEIKKIQQYQRNCMIYFISGSQGAFKVPLQNSGVPGPQTKINRALGIPSNWSRDPGPAMLFLLYLEFRKYSFSVNAVFKFSYTPRVFHNYLKLYINHDHWMRSIFDTVNDVSRFKGSNTGRPQFLPRQWRRDQSKSLKTHPLVLSSSSSSMGLYYFRSVS